MAIPEVDEAVAAAIVVAVEAAAKAVLAEDPTVPADQVVARGIQRMRMSRDALTEWLAGNTLEAERVRAAIVKRLL